MTNKFDNLVSRNALLGEGQEETVGVPVEGFEDPTGEYPKRDYFFGTNINKAAKGEKVNNLELGGGDFDVSLELPDQKPSQYPHNQVNETPSGHVIEVDDTPGGERVLLKHRTGAGVELRADGSVIISSRNQKVEVTGGDHKTIVEGEGTLIYKGNLNLQVDGDFNVDVRGNYNLNVAGDKKETIKGRHTKTVNLDQNYTVRGSRGAQVIGKNTETILDDNNVLVKGNSNNTVEGNYEIFSGGSVNTTAASEFVVASQTFNSTATTVSLIGEKGTIGGSLVDYYGKAYGGLPGAQTNTATFYGTLVGRATEAIHADYAMKASLTDFAKGAAQSIQAVSLGGSPPVPKPPKPGIMPYIPLPQTTGLPNSFVIQTVLNSTNYGIRNVSIDDNLKDKLRRADEYDELFNFDPDIHEIRSKLRDPANFNNEKLTGYLVSTGRLNSGFKKNIATNIGRSENKKGTIRIGNALLGNANENRSKRFKINTRKK